MSEVFDDAFRKTLGEILRRAPRLRGGQQQTLRGRRAKRSESGTFSGHRPYSEGEDLRNLDWNVYARTDELFLKVLEDEDRVGLTIVLDRSRSMLAGDRWTAARRVAAIVGGLALVHLDGLRLVLGGESDSVMRGAESLSRYLELLEGLESLAIAPTVLAERVLEKGAAGRLIWVSDFAEPSTFTTGLTMLRRHGCRCRGVLPSLPSDSVPVAEGFVEFENPESGTREVLIVDARLRGQMAAELRQLARQQDAVFSGLGYRLTRFPVPAEGDHRIASWTAEGAVYRD